jgi:hypothetical protein
MLFPVLLEHADGTEELVRAGEVYYRPPGGQGGIDAGYS